MGTPLKVFAEEAAIFYLEIYMGVTRRQGAALRKTGGGEGAPSHPYGLPLKPGSSGSSSRDLTSVGLSCLFCEMGIT